MIPGNKYHRFIVSFILLVPGFAATAEDGDDSKKETKPIPEPTSFVSQHKGRFNGQAVGYTVTAGETYLRDKKGDPKATLSTFAYTKDDLKVLVAAGYYDLVTPFFDAEYTLNRHDIRGDRVEYKYYGGGHMMYVNEPSRTQLLKDTRAFIQAQTAN
jgi:carboxypeptidase C (cathepsin A)